MYLVHHIKKQILQQDLSFHRKENGVLSFLCNETGKRGINSHVFAKEWGYGKDKSQKDLPVKKKIMIVVVGYVLFSSITREKQKYLRRLLGNIIVEHVEGTFATAFLLISCLMDPFDDLLPVAPAARTRPGAKFIPKAKSKQLPSKEIPASEHVTSSKDGISGDDCQNAVASSLSMLAEKSKGSIHLTQVEILNSETGDPKQVTVKADSAAMVNNSTITASEIDSDQNSTNFLKPVCEADLVDFEGGSVTNFVHETNLDNSKTQPVHTANDVENKLNNVAALSANTCSTIDRMKEPPKNGEGSFGSNKCLELTDNSLQLGTDLGFKISSDNHSKSNFGKEQEVVTAEFELDPFSDILPDHGARNAYKFKPKMKPRPRVGNTPAICSASASSNVTIGKSVALPLSCTSNFQSFQSCGDGSDGLNQSTGLPLPTSDILRATDLPNKFHDTRSSVPFSEGKSLAAAIPSQLDPLSAMNSEDAVHNGTSDWPSSFGKSSGEAADIFSGLESLDDLLTQAATDTRKPALHSFNEKGAEENFVTPACSTVGSLGECDTTQVQRCPEYHCPQDSLTFSEAALLNEGDTNTDNRRSETEEIVDFACPGDVFDCQSMDSGGNQTSEIPVHEELTNAAEADLLQADVTRDKGDVNKRERDGSTLCSQRKKKKSSIIDEEDKSGKTLRQLRRRAVCIPANSSSNEDVEDNSDLDPPYNSNGDELPENDDDYELDHSSKKKKVSTSSQKKSVAKNGKTSQKRRKANDDSEKTKELPKKFSHSTRRRKRCVNKALLEIPEDELDLQRLPMRDVILLAEHRERLAKKEASTSNNSPTNQSGGNSLHEAGGYNEWEYPGSEDGNDTFDDQANEGITSSSQLFNYQILQERTPRGNWSKQDTERFYEAVRTMGTDFSMIQLLFPDKTRHQIKLKFKNEDKKNRLCLDDAINSHTKAHSRDLWIEQVKLASTKAEDPSGDASDFMMAEEAVDLTAGTNEVAEEVKTTKADADVKAQEENFEQSEDDDNDDGMQKWSQYKSNY
ncbi:hypothetical protein VNO78_31221 [Psophocarpus tetragonolobus]|uniref:Myb-like domain-containing protein n=1 Tax=Psophocarpus tetragonolobus TaxID=3891 RepID=A0AAN9X949_PSOTE